ncbi:MAG: AAA family ATPase [Solobacterium sp.]|nr:AAA family ATPase [Solobacterium sp.]
MPRKQTDEQLLKESALRDSERSARREQRSVCFEILKQYETVFFRTFDRDLLKNELFHAFIFHGPQGSLKTQAAVLCAQSIVCPGIHGLVDEAHSEYADLLARVAETEYGDLYRIDGSEKKSIGIEKAADIQRFLSRTAAEESGRKILLLNGAEYMTEDAMNSLLKFLEEPAEQVYMFLVTGNVDRLLTTIRSRCMAVRFHPLPEQVYYDAAIREGLDPEDAFFLAGAAKVLGGYPDLAVSEPYQRAKTLFRQMLGLQGDPGLILVDYDTRYRFREKGERGDTGREKGERRTVRDNNLDTLIWFFEMLARYYRSVITGDETGPAWYSESVKAERSVPKARYIEKLQIVREARDKCGRTNDLNLLMDQTIYRLEKVA